MKSGITLSRTGGRRSDGGSKGWQPQVPGERVAGGPGADELSGADGDDELAGGDGPDELAHDSGNEALDGEREARTACEKSSGSGPSTSSSTGRSRDRPSCGL